MIDFLIKEEDLSRQYPDLRDATVLFQDPDGEHARRVLQRSGGMYPGGRGGDGGPGIMNLPPAIANNPNIPHEIINGLQAGRLGSTVFVANVSNTRVILNVCPALNVPCFSSAFDRIVAVIFHCHHSTLVDKSRGTHSRLCMLRMRFQSFV